MGGSDDIELQAECEGSVELSAAYTLPLLNFGSALDIGPPSDACGRGESMMMGEGREQAMEQGSSSSRMAEEGIQLFTPSTSYSSPLMASGSPSLPLSPSTSTLARGASTRTTRTRSSSNASEQTQRTVRQAYTLASAAPTSSSSSLHSLTPLASPTGSSGAPVSPILSPSSSSSIISSSSPTQLPTHSPTEVWTRTNNRPTADESDVAHAYAPARHHHHHRPGAGSAGGDYEQRRRSNSSSAAYSHGLVGRALPPTTASRRHQQHPHFQQQHSRPHDRRARSASIHTLSSGSDHCSPLPAPSDLVNNLSHDHQHHHHHHHLDAREDFASAHPTRPYSYTLVEVTSSSPLQCSPGPSIRADPLETAARADLRHLEDFKSDTDSREQLQEKTASQHTAQTDSHHLSLSKSASLPLSQTFEESVHAQFPAQGEETSLSSSILGPSASPQHPSLLPPTSQSASQLRPSLSYRIPSFGRVEPLIAALPESLAKLVILDSPIAAARPLPVVADDADQPSPPSEEDFVVSPSDIAEQDLVSSSPEDIETPPHSRHNPANHTPDHLHRLSTSLPASPTRDTHAALSEAFSAGARNPNSLRIPSFRARLDLPTLSSPTTRLPLTPLEEVNSPDMRLDSPADLAEPRNPFESRAFAEQLEANAASLGDTLDEKRTNGSTDVNGENETFYHALLELVNSETGYTADLTDLVEVHFSLLSFARFVTEEQRNIIIRDAARLVDLHRRLQEKLKRVDDDLGWIREDDEEVISRSIPSPTEIDELESPVSDISSTSTYSPSSPSSPSRQEQYFAIASPSRTKHSSISTRRFKSSDATVLDAARRISAIFINESNNLSEAYRPFCSGHSEAMDVVKRLASGGTKLEWDAFEAQCTAHLSSRRRRKSLSSSSRLHFADFLIKPVQRICRYPLLFGNLLKNAQRTALVKASAQHQQSQNMESSSIRLSASHLTLAAVDVEKSIERVREALQVSKQVAAAVDQAQNARALEIATVKLARRIEVQSPDHVNLLNKLDQVVLIGSAHVIYAHAPTISSQGLPSVLKAGFYGLVLYNSHLVFFKVKKTNVYEPRHWLPLRIFDLHKVPDGEGTLPYAFRMTCQDHTFEVGSLCHAEQDIWVEAIDRATKECRKNWLETIASNPIAVDENPICSLSLDAGPGMFDGVSPILASSEFGVFPASPEPSIPSVSRAASFLSSNDEGYANTLSGFRPRLSLKPPAQRVGVDLRLADLLSESILSARAQSKRSHAMPLHGPPPRAMTTPTAMPGGTNKRPHSFHPGGFSYRNIIDSTLTSRRTSLAESEASRLSANMKQVINGTANLPALPSFGSEDTLRRKPTKLRRSRTSAQVSDQEATDATTRPQRRSSTLGKIRRRATSLVSDSGPMKALEEVRMQEQLDQHAPKTIVTVSTQAGPVPIAVVTEQPILDESVQATVARNSSTSSSSSYASTSTDPSLGNSLETPQSSLPASPLLTPVDLETQSRWTKIGDALSHTLMRKRSFASQRPILAVPPEPLLEGIQLEQAQDAAEFIYTGRHACSGNCSHGTTSAATSSHSYEKRYSWDRVGWSNNTASGTVTRAGYGTHHRTASGVSAPPSMSGGVSQPNIFGGRSAPNLSSMADKRQASSGSLWSVFGGRNGDGHSVSYTSSSPAQSVYGDAQESEESSAYPSPAAQFVPLPDIVESSSRIIADAAEEGRVIPLTRANPLGGSVSSQAPAAPALSAPSKSATGSIGSPSSSSGSNLAPPAPGRSGSLIKRKNSLTARLRAFKALGSGMTPVRQQQPSRSYLSR